MKLEERPLNIFILEDDQSFLRLLQLRLKNWDNNIVFHTADTIAAANNFLETTSEFINIAILDHFLPDGTGEQLFNHSKLEYSAKIAMSSDDSPLIPSKSVRAGAMHFVHKRQISEPLFIPLIFALLERKEFENKLLETKLQESKLATIRTLIATLEHEINNPLGAVFGGIFLLKSSPELSKEQKESLKVVEESGKRIKTVLKELKSMTEIKEVTKGNVATFHLSNDKDWD
jgi:signal transduction histidine kinase